MAGGSSPLLEGHLDTDSWLRIGFCIDSGVFTRAGNSLIVSGDVLVILYDSSIDHHGVLLGSLKDSAAQHSIADPGELMITTAHLCPISQIRAPL